MSMLLTLTGQLGWTMTLCRDPQAAASRTSDAAQGGGACTAAIVASTLADTYVADADDDAATRARAAGLIEGGERMVLALAATDHFHADAVREAVDTVLENAANDV